MRKVPRVLRITRSRPDPDRDVRDEIDFYVEMRARELVEEGVEPGEARRRALARFGDPERIAAECRRVARRDRLRRHLATILSSMGSDLRHAVRDLARHPGFAVVAALTVALCIGANAAVFGVVEGVLLEPLPFAEPGRLVTIFHAYPGAGLDRAATSVPDWLDRRQGVEAFEEVALFNEISRTVGEAASAENVFSMDVTPSFFRVLGVAPFLGRTLEDGDAVPGNHRRAVIGHRRWQQWFGGDEAAVGATIRVSGEAYTVVGVMPPSFRLPTWDAGLWVPIVLTDEATSPENRHTGGYQMIARLRPGATVREAQEQIDALDEAVTGALPPPAREQVRAAGFRSVVRGLHDDLVRDVELPILLLWGGVALVLAIGCVNVAGLLSTRVRSRMRELATRHVLGASGWRLARQLLTEGFVLAAWGGGLGLMLGSWSLRFVDAFEVYQVPRIDRVGIDVEVVLFTLGLISAVGVLAGVLPVVSVLRRDLYAAFRGGAAAAPTAAGPGVRTGRRRLASLHDVLVVTQVALAVVLLAAAGLLVATVARLGQVDPGFETDGLLAAALTIPPERYPEAATRQLVLERILDEIRSIPEVVDAGAASQLPFSGVASQGPVTPESPASRAGSGAARHLTLASAGYLETLGVPLVAGRLIEARDGRGSPPVVVIDEALARRFWPGVDAVGKRLHLGADPGENAVWHSVVGVVGSIVQNDLTAGREKGAVYLPVARSGVTFTRLAVRTRGDPLEVVHNVRSAVATHDPEIPVFWVQGMDDAVRETLLTRRVPMFLIAGFAGVALLLAALGIYGVLAWSVARRTREIGIRVALGSSRDGVYRLVLGRAAVVIGIGLALGLAGARLLTGLMDSLLFEVRAGDPAVLAAAGLAIVASALVACWRPTRRALAVDPREALQHD